MMTNEISAFIDFTRSIFASQSFIPLHEPRFTNEEKQSLIDVIDSGYVSSVGKQVEQFERKIAHFTGSHFAVATVNGTAALHIALVVAGVQAKEEVLTQSLSFVATSNAIRYCGADPVFIDVNQHTLGMDEIKLEEFLHECVEVRDEYAVNKCTGKRIRACLPMHTFGHPANIDKITDLCRNYNITLIEDAAEALGSRYKNRACGCFGDLGVFSFNGNKIITTGGGGMVVTNNEQWAKRLKHLTTTAKTIHPWAITHDELGYNYRMPNLNAALGLTQMAKLDRFIANKRELAQLYSEWCEKRGIHFIQEPENAASNYWLNAILLGNKKQRDHFLQQTNAHDVMTRPVWEPLHRLPMYQHCSALDLTTTEWLADRLVNIPSSVRMHWAG